MAKWRRNATQSCSDPVFRRNFVRFFKKYSRGSEKKSHSLFSGSNKTINYLQPLKVYLILSILCLCGAFGYHCYYNWTISLRPKRINKAWWFWKKRKNFLLQLFIFLDENQFLLLIQFYSFFSFLDEMDDLLLTTITSLGFEVDGKYEAEPDATSKC